MWVLTVDSSTTSSLAISRFESPRATRSRTSRSRGVSSRACAGRRVHLSHGDLVEIFTALRALVNGTEPDEPNRAHVVTVAYVVAEAIEREGGKP